MQRHEHGDFGEGAETLVEFDLTGFEEAVGARFDFDNVADGEAGGEDAAEAGGDEAFHRLRAGEEVERHGFDDALRRAQSGIDASLVAEDVVVALDDAGESEVLARDKFDDGRGGINLRDVADDAAAEHHGGADGEAEVFALAEDDALPPAGKIAAGDAGVFETIVVIGGEPQQCLEARQAGLELGILLHGKFVGGVDAGEIAAGDDEFVVRVQAECPIFLETARIVGGDGDGRREFEETGASKRLEADRHEEPGDDDEPEGGKWAVDGETAEGHGRGGLFAHGIHGTHGKCFRAERQGSE
eukprot:TRINITY_DN30092_c0_g1_i1.p1 TRINITY_DN30092_c0_g1~~TRINITY_DN30092_c0_g1_i1.p1  ORF type:complete len:301 (-),score=46.99 TRINITY_DN30092_c0_g1_i1:568-1470(-)